MPISKFDKNNVKIIGAKLSNVIKAFAREHNLDVKISGGRFSDKEFVPKFHFQIKPENSEDGLTIEGQAYMLYAEMFDLKPEWLGIWFASMGGNTLRITGWKTRALKNKVLLEDKDGKSFHCNVNYILKHQGRLNAELKESSTTSE